MACANCALSVERCLNKLEGISEASVNYAARTALVTYDSEQITPEEMKQVVLDAGYDLVVEEDRSVEQVEKNAYRQLLRRVVVSWLLALLAMSISMQWLRLGDTATRNQTLFIIALANLLYCGRPFFASALRLLRHGTTNMDALVALSTAVSFLFSAYNTFAPGGGLGAVYYDASIMIITFVLTGRLIENHAKNGTASAIRQLMGLAPKTAHLVSGDGVTDVPIATLRPGDIVEIRAGEKAPVDGIFMEATDQLVMDESMMTGEPLSDPKEMGDRIFCGTVVSRGQGRYLAQQVGQQTVLAQIIRTVQQAQGSKAPVQRITDRVASVFVPTILILSLLTLLGWLLLPLLLPHPASESGLLERAVLSAVSVLVIACPCALGLATPTALMVGIGKAAQLGILIKDATALEHLRQTSAIIFDKTGTLTQPAPALNPAPAPLSAPEGATNANSHTGNEAPSGAVGGAGAGAGASSETLKPHAREAVETLRQMGIDIYMMSGDKEERAAHWAREAGIDHYQSRALPQDKEDLVRRLQGEGHHVAMIGDGINDTQALAIADVSIAMGKGTDVAIDVAQVTLMGTDLRHVADAINLSKQTTRTIYQNLFWAFIYNIVCIPLAAGLPHLFGYDWQITPMWASALMAFSSISVVLNSLRLKLHA